MDQQTVSIDQTYDSLKWVSDRPPHLHVHRILFLLPSRKHHDFEWVDRLMRTTLKFECRIVDPTRPMDPIRSTSGGVPLGRLIAPHTVQPLFDIDRAWQFQAPAPERHHLLTKPHWETRIWLDGFDIRDGESVTLMLTANARFVAELAA